MPEGQLKTTIIVPVFNTEPYLQRCIESLLGQTRTDFEIIVVDDSSAGNTEAIVEHFQPAQPEIKYVRHPSNLGVLRARFTGVDQSSGDYVGFLDSDDIARPHYVERLLAAAAESSADIVGSAKDDKTKGVPFAIEGADALLKAYAAKQIPNWAVWTKLYRKELVLSLSELRDFADSERLIKANDLLFNIFCALKGPRYANIPDTLVDYTRGRAGSITNPVSFERRRESFESALRAYEIMRAAASGFEDSVDQIIFLSARNAYRSTLAAGDERDIAWAREALARSPLGSLITAAMFDAAAFDRRLFEMKTRELRQKLSQTRDNRDKWKSSASIQREKVDAERAKRDEMRDAFNDERRQRQRLRVILADLLRWARNAIR